MFDYNKINWKLNGDKTVLDFYACNYHIQGGVNKFTFEIVSFSCNGTDLNCTLDSIFNGPFVVMFDKTLPSLERINEVSYDNEDIALIIDGMRYTVVNTDLYYFLSDFQGDSKQALGNLMKNVAEYLAKDYGYSFID